MTLPLPTTTAPLGYFGANRLGAERVGQLFPGRFDFIGVGCVGGASELFYLTGKARTSMANDLHPHAINLYRVWADPVLKDEFRERLTGKLFHPDTIAAAAARCSHRQDLLSARADLGGGLFGAPSPRVAASDAADIDWAVDYFVVAWMGRGGTVGTSGEFNGGLSIRYDAGGGDSAGRYVNAVEGIDAWHELLKSWAFTREDVGEFIARCLKVEERQTEKAAGEPTDKRERRGLYFDFPFPEVGDPYRFNSTFADHRKWAASLHQFRHTLVVLRYYDHPLIRELYPEGERCRWHRWMGRDRHNNAEKCEVLIEMNGEVARG